jgi:hypothetical protein
MVAVLATTSASSLAAILFIFFFDLIVKSKALSSRTRDQWFILGHDDAPTILENIPSDRSRYSKVSELEGSFGERFERKERG